MTAIPLSLLSYSANSDRRPNLFRANAVNRKRLSRFGERDYEGVCARAQGAHLFRRTASNMKDDSEPAYVFFFSVWINVDRFGATHGLFDW